MKLKELKALEDGILFTMDMNQLYASLKAVNITQVNAVSPIDLNLQSPGAMDPETEALVSDPDFKACIDILCQPQRVIIIKGHHEKEGAFGSTVCIKADQAGFKVVWTTIDAQGRTTFTTFNDPETWLAYYMAVRDYTVDYPHKAPLDFTFDAPSFMLFLHSMDVYKHAYYGAMLEYSTDVGDVISQKDYFALLERSAQSTDKRWLLPSALGLSPWGRVPEIEFTSTALSTLMAGKIIQPTTLVDANKGFRFDSEGLFLAIEYAALKKDVSLFTIRKAEGTGKNCFVIATDEAMHIYDVTNKDQIAHETMTSEGFYKGLLAMLA